MIKYYHKLFEFNKSFKIMPSREIRMPCFHATKKQTIFNVLMERQGGQNKES